MGLRIETTDHAVPWMVRHASGVISIFAVGTDGNGV